MSKPKVIQETIDLGDGRSISIETGVLAKQADGAVMVRMGDTMVLASVVSAKNAKEDVDFMVEVINKVLKEVRSSINF